MDHLFKNYNKSLRPSETVGQPVNMTFGIAYVQLVELDDKDQVNSYLVMSAANLGSDQHLPGYGVGRIRFLAIMTPS